MLLAPYYRRFELPWEGDSEASLRYRRILRVGLVLLVLLGILIPLLPAPPRPASEEAIPQRLARVMIENQVKPPPPPPPPPVVQEPLAPAEMLMEVQGYLDYWLPMAAHARQLADTSRSVFRTSLLY